MTKIGAVLGAMVAAVVLTGCEREVILAGQRFDTRTPLDQAMAEASGAVQSGQANANRSVPIALGQPQANADWTHRAGNASHAMPHLALAQNPQPLWQASIGRGDNSRHRLSVAPIVAGGRVYTIDTQSRLTATVASNGATAWTTNLTPAGEGNSTVNGGGLAYADGRLYATTGFGEALALDPASGAVIWRHKFSAPVSGAPVAQGGTLYVTGRDGAGWALDGANGTVKWVQTGVRQGTGILGGTAPALSGNNVIVPLSSGQVIAIDRAKGETVWQGAVAGRRAGYAAGFLSELTGDPVVSGGKVYVGSSAGQTVAFNATNGQMLWNAAEGSMNPVWPVGNAVFLVNDIGELVRLDAASGASVWKVPMGHFTREKAKKQLEVYAHYGPVLAGGRLVVASSDGKLRFFSPESGAALGSVEMGDAAVAAPAVAAGVIYVLTSKGQLRAFR